MCISFPGRTPYFGGRYSAANVVLMASSGPRRPVRITRSRLMRVATVIGVLLLGGAATVRAQHAHQLEFGGYGTYTRYDRAFLLNNQFGGGGRLGYFFNHYIRPEVDANISYPTLKNPPPGGLTQTQLRLARRSTLINRGGHKN